MNQIFLESMSREIVQAGYQMIAMRIRHALIVAGITVDDIRAGRALWAKIVSNHDACGGTGLIVTKEGHSINVAICECMEIRIIRPIDP